MRFKIIILFIAIIQLSAKGYGQGINLSLKNASIEEAFKAIEKQTGYSFIYGKNQLKQSKPVNLDVNNERLETILELIFKDQPLTYTISGKYIAVKEKPGVEKKEDSYSKPPVDVKGRVVNEKGEPTIASVAVKGTNKGVSTNEKGEFVLQGVEEDAILIISGINIETQEIKVIGKKDLNITVKIRIAEGEEVIVNAGYYKVKDNERTGSISKVDAKTIEKQPVTNPMAAISGRMPGVYIEQISGTPGSEFKIQIRGRSSLRDDGNEPLFIIDGVPLSMDKTFSYNVQGSFGRDKYGISPVSPLTSVNPSDIESIEVLKDADATAIYGSRGANGVVLITTKKGKAGKIKYDLNVFTGMGKARRVELLDTKQFLALRKEAFANDGIIPNATAGSPGYSPELMIWDTTRYTDWQKVLMSGSAQTINAQSSISGGNEHTQFLLSLGYRRENSVYPGDFYYQRGTFHLGLNHRSASKKFFISANVNAAKDNNDQPAYRISNTSRMLAPNAPALYDGHGNLNWENSTWNNPLAEINSVYRNDAVNFTINNVIGYEVISELQFKINLGVNYIHSDEVSKYPHTRFDPAQGLTSANSAVSAGNGTNQSWIIEPEINWVKKIASGNLTFLVGSSFQEQKLNRKADFYLGFPSDALMGNLSSAASISNYETIISLYRYIAVFGRLNYSWDKKYILNLTARRDGSSRFGPGKQFANFGAVGAAWVFSKENWIQKNIPFVSFGKIRVSYGSTGSDQIGNYRFLDTYSTNTSSSLINQYQGITWLSPTRLFNPDYAWEINKKLEFALETRFLKDHLSLTIGFFRNQSSNQLVNYNLPRTTGFAGILANLPATVQNTGWEAELSAINLKERSKIGWTTSFNITIPRNELIEFPGLELSSYANQYVVGQPLSIYKAFESTGVDPATGLWTFRDINGDGKITRPEDNTKVIFWGQNFYGGLNNSLTYKGWSLDVFFQFVKQNGIEVYGQGSASLGKSQNVPAFILEKRIWRKPGDIADIQRITTYNNVEAGNRQSNFISSDAIWGDASFIRLKNVALSYQLPQKWTKNFKCRFYFQGQNLLLITGYEGDDPENQSFDYLAPLRMLTAGIQLTL